MKKIIKDDLFSISYRIKSIDSGYYIVYDTVKDRYELHNERCRPSLQVVFPYASLDKRALEYAYRTSKVNIVKELLDMDNFNAALESEKLLRAADEASYKYKELIQYYENGGKEEVGYEKI